MSDLIRREDAIDYFVTNICIVDADGYAVDDYDERVKMWTERFSGIPSAEPERKWIPFEVALPNDRQKVLCLNKHDEMMVGGYMSDYGNGSADGGFAGPRDPLGGVEVSDEELFWRIHVAQEKIASDGSNFGKIELVVSNGKIKHVNVSYEIHKADGNVQNRGNVIK